MLFKFLLSIFVVSASLAEGDLSQWRGPARDGLYPDKNLLKKWPAAGPKLLWEKLSVGSGHSSPAVTEEKIFVTGMQNGEGILTCFDKQGNQLWSADYGPEWQKNYPGARSTPTVIGNDLYLISGTGRLVCFDTDTGKKRWSVELFKKFSARNIEWGFNESPLVDEDRVICTPGGAKENIAAFNRFDGQVVWISKGNGEPSAYCSPLLIEHKGKKQIVTRTAKSVLGIEPETGALLWRYPQTQEYDIQANTPLYHNGRLFCLSGSDNSSGAVMLELSDNGQKLKQRWQNTKADNLIGGVVLANGYLFSSRYDRGEWFCLSWESGEIAYMSRDFGGGAVIYADGLFYCYSDKGQLGLIKADDKKFEVISSFKIENGRGPHWAHPVIRDGWLYVRHGEALMVYNITES